MSRRKRDPHSRRERSGAHGGAAGELPVYLLIARLSAISLSYIFSLFYITAKKQKKPPRVSSLDRIDRAFVNLLVSDQHQLRVLSVRLPPEPRKGRVALLREEIVVLG